MTHTRFFGTGSIAAMGAMLSAILVSGCAAGPKSAMTEPRSTQQGSMKPAQTQPATIGPVPLKSVSDLNFVYRGGWWSAAPLNAEQKQSILAEAEQYRPANRDIWFVRVGGFYPIQPSLPVSYSYAVEVFFTPDVDSPRIRKGKSVQCGMFETPEDQQRKARERNKPWRPEEYLQDYIQVSLPEKPFATGVVETPSMRTLPFNPPKELSESDVVELLDWVRRNPTVKVTERGRPREIAVNPGFWLDNIKGNSEVAHVKIRDSFFSGFTLDFRREEGGWKLISAVDWLN